MSESVARLNAALAGRYQELGLEPCGPWPIGQNLRKAFAARTGGDATSSLVFRAIYNRLSIYAHPTPRLDARFLRINEEKGLFELGSGDARTVAAEVPGLGILSSTRTERVLWEVLVKPDTPATESATSERF